MKRSQNNRPLVSVLARGLGAGMLAALMSLTAQAQGYRVNNLVSDVPGAAASTDTNLVNAWGLEIAPGGTLVVAATETSQVRFYHPDGRVRDFSIAVDEDPTGLIFNHFPGRFRIHDGGTTKPSLLLFATEAGRLMGWNPRVNLAEAVVAVDNSAHEAVYKGIAQAWSWHGPRLYATDFHGGQVEIYDEAFHWVGAFTDPQVDAGFVPFNIVNISGLLYVTFAKQEEPERKDDARGPGNGFVDIFSPEGRLLRRLISHGPLNSPWGMALAPDDFGRFGRALLVGNFGDGTINAFHPFTGRLLGTLSSSDGNPLIIDGLWGLKFGGDSDEEWDNPVLYFTSGPVGESHGLVGSVVPVKRHSMK